MVQLNRKGRRTGEDIFFPVDSYARSMGNRTIKSQIPWRKKSQLYCPVDVMGRASF